MGILDDFEDGVDPGWTGDTGNLSAQTNVVLSGTQSGNLTATDESPNVDSPSAGNLQAPLEFKFQFSVFSTSDFDSVSFYVYSSSRAGILTMDDGDQNLAWYDGTSYQTVLSSVSTGTTYDIEIVPDFGANTVDIVVDGVTELAGVGMENAVNDFDYVRVNNNTQNTTQTRDLYLDDIQIGDATLPITIDGEEVREITIDGQSVQNITIDGTTVF